LSRYSAYAMILLGGIFQLFSPGLFAQENEIRIGFLVPDSTQTDLILAARLAVEEANAGVIPEGELFRLVVRSTEGPWGAGSKESVRLVYEDSVLVIVGALDGRNGHLAEQVATKSHLAYLETRAMESTLSQAFVPWFLRCVPNDDQQARALLALISEHGGGTVAVLSDEQYDHHNAAESFRRIAAMDQVKAPVILEEGEWLTETGTLIETLNRTGARHLVIPFQTQATLQLIRTLRNELPHLQLYGTLGFITGMVPAGADWNAMEGMVLISPGEMRSGGWVRFQQRYFERSGHTPTIAAAYVYDGISLVIRAIGQSGRDRETLRTFLPSFSDPGGVTGPVAFDGSGNRSGSIRFIQIRSGIPAPL
jgi:branched-chain amino acid transport system substrate-binding protein